MKFRTVKHGEKILATDKMYSSIKIRWVSVGKHFPEQVGLINKLDDKWIRRPIKKTAKLSRNNRQAKTP